MQGRKDHQEKLFTTFQLSDRVPENNFYRGLRELLDLRFLYALTSCYYGKEGQKSIDPVVFFKLILVGYLENLNSDRKIIEHVSMRLDILYFIGYNIDDELPWHSTLSRTRQLYGEEIFRDLFKKMLFLCIEKGMVKGKRQAIDSAYIKANASLDSLVEKEVIADADTYADELNENNQEQKKKTVDYNRKRAVDQHHKWKKKAYQDMPGKRVKKGEDDDGSKDKRPKYLSNHTHHSTTDPDARISVKPGKPRQLNYSAQTSVDTSSHVITNIMADFADKRDSQSLPQAVEQTRQNLKENGLELEEVLADTGYSSGEALKYLERKGITGYIPNFGQYKPFREGFSYDKENDRYICSQGVFLPLKKIKQRWQGNLEKHYRSSRKDCKNCPLKSQCIGKSFEKTIRDTIDKPYYDRMHERMKTPKAKRMKKIRQSTVEPVLGTLINFMGMRRIWTRGIEQAKKFMLGAAIAYNLKKWMKFKTKKANAAVIALSGTAAPFYITGIYDLFSSIIGLFYFESRHPGLKTSLS